MAAPTVISVPVMARNSGRYRSHHERRTLAMLSVDPVQPFHPYEQIRSQVLALISEGELKPETRLPTVRKLAADLGVAPNTVARTYRILELIRAIETRGRHGTFVSAHEDPIPRQAQKAAEEYAHHIRSLGLGNQDASAFLKHDAGTHLRALRWAEWFPPRVDPTPFRSASLNWRCWPSRRYGVAPIW
ncbi:GntR family transcriptional regulator [Arthrobacter sp. Sr24]